MIGGLAFLITMGCIALAYPYTTAQQHPTAVNRVPSSPSSPSTLIVSLPPDLFDYGEEDIDFHAAREAGPTGHAQQTREPSTSSQPTTAQQPAKFPDNNRTPHSPESSNKMLVAIISASTGGVVVLGAVALFVWHTHSRRDMSSSLPITAEDDPVPYEISKFPEPPYPSLSPTGACSSSSDDGSSDDDDSDRRSTRIPRPNIEDEMKAQEESEPSITIRQPQKQKQQRRLSAIVEEKNHVRCVSATEDFQVSTLDELAKVAAKFVDAEDSGYPDKTIAILDSPDRSATSSNRCVLDDPSHSTSIKTTDTLNNLTHKLLRYPPLVAREEYKHLHQQQEQADYQRLVTSTSSLPSTSHFTGAPNLTYPLRKLIHHPSQHSTPRRQKRQSLDNSSLVGQRDILPVTPLGMPATQFVPLQNSPFHFVPRLSIMLDPEKRQGIHEVPKDDI